MTLHSLTKSVQIVCQGTFALFSGIVFSFFGIWRLFSLEDAVQVKLCFASGPDGENVRDPRIAVKDVSPELRHLDERESDSVMLAWPEICEAKREEKTFFISGCFWQNAHIGRCFRQWLRSSQYLKLDGGVVSRDLSDDVPSEEILSSLGDIAEDAVPAFDRSEE